MIYVVLKFCFYIKVLMVKIKVIYMWMFNEKYCYIMIYIYLNNFKYFFDKIIIVNNVIFLNNLKKYINIFLGMYMFYKKIEIYMKLFNIF